MTKCDTDYGPNKLPPNDDEVHLMSGPLKERARELGKAKGTIWYWRRKITDTRRHDDSCLRLCTNYDEQQDEWLTFQTWFASAIRTVESQAAALRTTAGAGRAI